MDEDIGGIVNGFQYLCESLMVGVSSFTNAVDHANTVWPDVSGFINGMYEVVQSHFMNVSPNSSVTEGSSISIGSSTRVGPGATVDGFGLPTVELPVETSHHLDVAYNELLSFKKLDDTNVSKTLLHQYVKSIGDVKTAYSKRYSDATKHLKAAVTELEERKVVLSKCMSKQVLELRNAGARRRLETLDRSIQQIHSLLYEKDFAIKHVVDNLYDLQASTIKQKEIMLRVVKNVDTLIGQELEQLQNVVDHHIENLNSLVHKFGVPTLVPEVDYPLDGEPDGSPVTSFHVSADTQSSSTTKPLVPSPHQRPNVQPPTSPVSAVAKGAVKRKPEPEPDGDNTTVTRNKRHMTRNEFKRIQTENTEKPDKAATLKYRVEHLLPKKLKDYEKEYAALEKKYKTLLKKRTNLEKNTTKTKHTKFSHPTMSLWKSWTDFHVKMAHILATITSWVEKAIANSPKLAGLQAQQGEMIQMEYYQLLFDIYSEYEQSLYNERGLYTTPISVSGRTTVGKSKQKKKPSVRRKKPYDTVSEAK